MLLCSHLLDYYMYMPVWLFLQWHHHPFVLIVNCCWAFLQCWWHPCLMLMIMTPRTSQSSLIAFSFNPWVLYCWGYKNDDDNGERVYLENAECGCCQFNQVTVEDTSSPLKCPITTRLVLETDEETKEPIIEVHKKLIRKLKPHQVDGMYCRIVV